MCGVRLRCFTKSTAYHILYLKWDSMVEHWAHANIRISIQLDFLRLPFLIQNSKDWTSWGVSEDKNLYYNGRTNNAFINPSIRLIFLNRISNMIQQVLYLLLLQEFIIKTKSPRFCDNESELQFANTVNSRGNDFNFQKVFRNCFRFMLSLQWFGQSFNIQWNCKSRIINWWHITYLKFKSNIPRSITIRSIDERSGPDKEIKKNKGNSKPKPVYTQAST